MLGTSSAGFRSFPKEWNSMDTASPVYAPCGRHDFYMEASQ